MWYIILCYVYVVIISHCDLWHHPYSLERSSRCRWCRSCSRWLRWRFSAWWPLMQLETALALLQWLFRPGACTRTNHVFATMRSSQCNQCQDSMRQINPNGFQSLRYSMYDYDFVAINIFELSWVEYKDTILQVGNAILQIWRSSNRLIFSMRIICKDRRSW